MKLPFLVTLLVLSAITVSSAFGEALPPLLQLKAGFSIDEVICNEDMVKMTDSPRTKVACVSSATADIFSNRGWERATDTEPSVGEIEDSVRVISTTQVESVGAKKSSTTLYDHVLEVCAGSVSLVSPELILKSDVETRHVTLASDIEANSCIITTASILAINPSITKAEITKQDDIVSKISSIRTNLETLIVQLDEEKKHFASLLLMDAGAEKDTQISESTSKIVGLRQSINELKDDINRYYFVLYANTPSPKAISPQSQDGASSVTLVSTSQSRSGNTFDVVLKVCAGDRMISNPMVDLSSDTRQQTLKLTKLIPNTCYNTGAKIEASSAESITAAFSESTIQTTSMEDTIRGLEQQLTQKRAALLELTENTVNPDPATIRQLSNEISSLRENIVGMKAAYYQSLYKAYK